MNNKYTKYALGALVFLVVFGSFHYEAKSAVKPQILAYSEVTGTLSTHAVQPVQQTSTTITGQLTATVVPSVITPVSNATPARISIPTATVNAEIIPIGVTKTNNLDVPPNFVQTGWYKYGPIPGQIGNAVIDGHVDNAGSIDGPFKHLTNARVGDEIYVTMSDGSVVTFVVTDASIYLTTQFPSRSVFVGDGQTAVLKIITCNGTYKPSMGTYDHRLIVTAVRKN
ncbi:MAG TPA: class F sortase [Candidatus Paceibacterota bacterium]